MVLCVVVGCSSKSGKHKGSRLFRILKVITNHGEEQEELTIKRRNSGFLRLVGGMLQTRD